MKHFSGKNLILAVLSVLFLLLILLFVGFGGSLKYAKNESPIHPETVDWTVEEAGAKTETTEPESSESDEETQEETTEVDETNPDQESHEITDETETVNGNESGNAGDHGEENPDGTELGIVTNLKNCEVTYAELTDDTLPFYAYIVNGTSDMTLRVKVRNSSTSLNGTYLTGSGREYNTKLQRKEANFITLYIRENNQSVFEVTYIIQYVAQKADESHPTVGEHPPVIVTNLDNHEPVTSNQNFTFVVTATDYQGKTIYESGIEVRVDGVLQKNPTGGPAYEYQLFFPNPVIGDEVNHKITVLAWDNEGNSAYKQLGITYKFVDTGEEIGTAYIILDATTVGLDILEEPYEVRIRQGEPASIAVMEMLNDLGYEFEYGGNPHTGFYLRRIIRGGLMDWAEVPARLWTLILKDGIGLTGQFDYDSLGEFDYTRGSGWMYSVNGVNYAGKGLSNYFLGNGDILYLRYTLAFGKDIGGASASGSYSGVLNNYCGLWINGQDTPLHKWTSATVEEGEEPYEICAICGERREP